MLQAILIRQLLLLAGLFISTLATSQTKSVFIGEWHFFDNDNNYCEWTVTPNFLYQYHDSSQPTRQKVFLTNNTLTTAQSCWTIKANNEHFLLVDFNNHEIKLFRKQKKADTVKSLYGFLNSEHNGNAAMMFMKEATERKQRLIDKTKNGL